MIRPTSERRAALSDVFGEVIPLASTAPVLRTNQLGIEDICYDVNLGALSREQFNKLCASLAREFNLKHLDIMRMLEYYGFSVRACDVRIVDGEAVA